MTILKQTLGELYTIIKNIMRIILLAIVVLFGTNLALKSYDRVDKIQQEKMQQLCKIDPDYCIPQ